MQISFAVTAKLISAFVFATRIVQSFYFLNPKFQASSHLVWLYSPVCVGPGRKPRRPVFSQRGSYELAYFQLDSATSLIQAAKNLMNAVVLTVKACYVASTKVKLVFICLYILGCNVGLFQWSIFSYFGDY